LLLRLRARAATSASATTATCSLCLLARLLRLLLRPALLLLLSLLLLRPLRLLLLLLRLLSLLLAALTLPLTIASRRAFFARAAFGPARLSRPLFKVADFPLHVPAGLLLLLGARFIMAAVGAPFPPLGICALAGRAED
jgi:hypothetical protein